MPYYTLECPACQHRQETVARWSEVPTVTCGACGTTGLTIVPTPTNFTIKGFAASTGYTYKKP